ncbi:MAG TPA: Coagulation factor 5/8 type domain-containing protein [Solirubrobacterales bacterium]
MRIPRPVAVVALLAALLGSIPASPASAVDSRYSLAGECRTLRIGAGEVTSSGLGYAVRSGAGSPFYMKASGLGSYLLQDPDGRLIATGALGNTVLAAARPGPTADWGLRDSGAGFELVSLGSGRSLAVDGSGRLIQSNGQGATVVPQPAEGCSSFPEPGLGASGEPWRGATSYGEVEGTIDGHNHVTAYEFLGGDAHCGEPWSRYGAPAALIDCPDHYPNGAAAALENVLYGNPVRTHDPVGWPTFKDWPAPESLTHEQTYYRWIERAYLGGVRIMVNDLVENVALCDIYPIKHNSCRDMDSIRLQARRIHELEEYIDAQAGGPGQGWFRIVRSPFEARTVINEGKLAVVLGIETSEIFDCGGSEAQPRCDRDQIVRGLDEIEAMGVASLFPIHKFDNAFGGVRFDGGAFGVAINAANLKQTGAFWNIQPCEGPEHDNEQDTALPGGEAGILGAAALSLLPGGTAPVYGPPPHCNARGLTPLGEFLIEQMIDRGLMIELDHEGERTAKRVLEIAEQHGYSGLIASHSWSDSHMWPRIYRLGGFAEPITSGAESFIEEWQQLKAASDPRFKFGMGFGADANGFHAQPSARGAGQPSPVAYPFKSLDGRVTFEKQVAGQRTWDVNVDGVAQYGLHPDWMEQLRLLAGKPIADDLMNGAEAYLQTWERAVGVPGPRCLAPPKRLSRTGFGPLRLGRDTHQTLMAAGQPGRRADTAFRWCSSRGKAKRAKSAGAAVVFDGSGKTVLVLSTAAGKGKPKHAKKLGKGLFVKRKGPGGDRVWGYRKGKLRFSAVATPKLARKAKAFRAALRQSGLE